MPITYKCPSCGSVMAFDSSSQMLKCGQCESQISVNEYEATYGENVQEMTAEVSREWDVQDSGSLFDGASEKINMKTYHCQSCGAELMSDEYTSAVMCSFCGNPSLVEDRLQGAYKPSKIIPFKIAKEQAMDIYRSWIKKGPLTPAALKTDATVEKISGLYVPYWLFDFKARSQMTASAEKIRRTRRQDTEYTYHDHFRVFRDVEADFVKIPADASDKMQDNLMDMLEPYDYTQLVDFSMPYLSGYLSERYNSTDNELNERVVKRVDKYITELARDTIKGYDTVNVTFNQINRIRKNTEYVLLPVWVLNCRFQGKEFSFMLNAQTGKIVANRPISIGKAVLWGVLVFIISLAIMMIGGLFI